MATLCWATKGGSGTTVVTATLALESERPALLVDLAGEIPTVLGMSEPDRPGVYDWLTADGAPSQLDDLLIEIDDTTTLLPCRGERSPEPLLASVPIAHRWRTLAQWFDEWEQRTGGHVWVDAGTGSPPRDLADAVEHRWLVTRACYLSLHRAARGATRPTGVVLVDEPGRSLRRRDVERSAGASIVATIHLDPKVARAVDSGLLASRPPQTIRRELRRVSA